MAKQIWDNSIDMNTDWAGDASTNNQPVSGRRVQEFIKNQLNSKASTFYYDAANQRYLVFANDDTKDEYLADPTKTDLVLGTFDAPSNYTAEINLTTPTYVAALANSTGNLIKFTFDVKNKSNQSVGENVICTYTIIRGANKQVINQNYKAGESVSFNVDKYLSTGTNMITITITGQTTLAATTVGITYQVIDLVLTDSYNLSTMYQASENIEVPFDISGYGAKYMEWYLDGTKLDYIQSEDQITEVSTSRTKYIPATGLSIGKHSLQFRAYVIVNGEKFYSKLIYRDVIVYDNMSSNQNIIIAVGTEFPVGVEPLTSTTNLTLYGVTQYVPYKLRFAVYDPKFTATIPLEIYIDGNKVTTINMSNGVVETYDFVVTGYGSKTIKLKTASSEYNISTEVEKSTTALEEITDGLVLNLSAVGKSNNSSDKDKWTYDDITTTFENVPFNEQCGWNNNRLVLDGNTPEIFINYNPFATDAISTGKTIEYEFSVSKDVPQYDNISSAGFVFISTNDIRVETSLGTRLDCAYKPGENIRVAIVINKATGVNNKGMIFVYINGILSGAVNYAENDNMLDSNVDFINWHGWSNYTTYLKQVRIYDRALSSDQILNNYILYRDTTEEMLSLYNKNNVYEEGSTSFSTDVLSGQLPVMIVTGNIPALEATTDKNLQIDVDVDYINLQDPSRSFKLRNGAMRPQGTSSMSYPKKNFRLYTQKKDNTVLYDYNDNVVENKLYSFKEGAQPVNCWCFKADYAESSGTHNTGIARLWNDVLKNFQINGEYKGRTLAQVAAIASNYKYDVRTCIDGFPILMFYRLDVDSPLVFIGKYNFNNDKSTESVFGFKDVPGFDNTNMQCWEVLNNGNHLALFNDTINWDGEWDLAFEGRYPDGNTNTTQLKAFATWMTTVTQSEFATEKWNHFDVYKMAAYYIYLMRFGAVDQVVKNAMFTSEDGVHWFYINYDNDTINGLRNDGLLIYQPNITRQTLDSTSSTGAYAYAGHESRLWNMLEADTEFMSIVQEVDNALYSAGLSYANVIKMFDDNQADKWCERIYNQDAQYKYIGPYNDRGINNLFMLQGSRQQHRRWWLSERFSFMDSKLCTGEYKSNAIELKLANAPSGLSFKITAGKDDVYGYGVNNNPIQYGIELNSGSSHTFTTESVLNVGDPLRIYAAPFIKILYLTNLAPYITQLNLANANSERFGTALRQLWINNATTNNTSLTEISGLNQCTKLDTISLSNLSALKTLNLSSQTKLKGLDIKTTGITSLILPENAPINYLSLSLNLASFKLVNCDSTLNILTSSTTTKGIYSQNNFAKLSNIEIINCPNVDTKTLLTRWLANKTTADGNCSLTLHGINWEDFNVDTLVRLGRNLQNLSLKGKITVSAVTEEQVNTLQEIFGQNCFSPTAELFIDAPAGIYLTGPSELRDFDNGTMNVAVFGAVVKSTIWTIESSSNLITIDSVGHVKTGAITSEYNVTAKVTIITDDGDIIQKSKAIRCYPHTYVTSIAYNDTNVVEIKKPGDYEFDFTLNPEDADYIDVTYSAEVPSTVTNVVITPIETTQNNKFKFNVSVTDEVATETTITIKAIVKNINGDTNRTITIKSLPCILNILGNIIMTKTSNSIVLGLMYNAGFCSSPNYMTDVEAAQVTSLGTTLSNNYNSITFNELQYFINLSDSTINIGRCYEFTIPDEIITTKQYNTIINSPITIHAPNLTEIKNTQTAKSTFKCDLYNINMYLDAPKLTKIHCLDISNQYAVTNAYIQTLNAPNLTTILADIRLEVNDTNLPNLNTIINNSLNYGLNFRSAGIVSSALTSLSYRIFNHIAIPNNINIIDLPNVESIIVNNANKISMYFDTFVQFNFPKLKTIDVDGYQYIFTVESLPKLNALENVSCYALFNHQYGYTTQTSNQDLTLPNLKTITNKTVNNTYNYTSGPFFGTLKLNNINLPALEIVNFNVTYSYDYNCLFSTYNYNVKQGNIYLPNIKELNGNAIFNKLNTTSTNEIAKYSTINLGEDLEEDNIIIDKMSYVSIDNLKLNNKYIKVGTKSYNEYYFEYINYLENDPYIETIKFKIVAGKKLNIFNSKIKELYTYYEGGTSAGIINNYIEIFHLEYGNIFPIYKATNLKTIYIESDIDDMVQTSNLNIGDNVSSDINKIVYCKINASETTMNLLITYLEPLGYTISATL